VSVRVAVVNECSLMLSQDSATGAQSAAWARAVTALFEDAVIDQIPAFNSLLIMLDISKKNIVAYKDELEAHAADITDVLQQDWQPRRHELPVYYGRECALDADDIAAQCGMSFSECVDMHADREYQVLAVGFAPGFSYLGELDQRLQMPRKATPRLRVPAGSVAIAQSQTAIYPAVSPGGWHIIGNCPELLVDMDSETICRLQTGDVVRFFPIEREEFSQRGGMLP
jgi:KipI family sensor histidine kinase inhibitor